MESFWSRRKPRSLSRGEALLVVIIEKLSGLVMNTMITTMVREGTGLELEWDVVDAIIGIESCLQ